MDPATVIPETGAPSDRPTAYIDAREMGPPEPLRETLETLPELDDDVVLVQHNDRVPKHLFPKLDARGYEHETVAVGSDTATAIWRP
jgi:hypothetical protein